MRHLLTLSDVQPIDIERIFSITEDLKTKYSAGLREALLPGRVMALLFEKPSLRTRVSFEAGMSHLGGSSLFLGDDVGFGARETLSDFGRILSQYVDVIVVRAFRHQTVIDMAGCSSVAVINGLTDVAHPLPGPGRFAYTLKELFGRLGRSDSGLHRATRTTWPNLLAEGCGRVGMKFVMATPPAYRFDDKSLKRLKRDVPDLELVVTADPAEAVREATAVYTDVWASMGQESEAAQRRKDFVDYQVNARLMKAAPKEAVFMHCLPAHRGEEVTDEVIDGPQSVVVPQASNRLHVQKGILAWILR